VFRFTERSPPMTSFAQKDQSLVRGVAGATVASYAIVTGVIAVACIAAISYLNASTEKRVQELGDKAGSTATNKGSASLGGEVAKSTAIMGGVEMPFQFGLPLFALPYTNKKKDNDVSKDVGKNAGKDGKDDGVDKATPDKACPGGKCGGENSTCFVAGTLVLTPSGYRKIEDIRVGDEVLSVAEDSPWASPAAELAEADLEQATTQPEAEPTALPAEATGLEHGSTVAQP
jgi:Flp pilus assembly pilin Flp